MQTHNSKNIDENRWTDAFEKLTSWREIYSRKNLRETHTACNVFNAKEIFCKYQPISFTLSLKQLWKTYLHFKSYCRPSIYFPQTSESIDKIYSPLRKINCGNLYLRKAQGNFIQPISTSLLETLNIAQTEKSWCLVDLFNRTGQGPNQAASCYVIVVILYAIINPPSWKAATIFKPYSITGMCLSGSRSTDPSWVQDSLSSQSGNWRFYYLSKLM